MFAKPSTIGSSLTRGVILTGAAFQAEGRISGTLTLSSKTAGFRSAPLKTLPGLQSHARMKPHWRTDR